MAEGITDRAADSAADAVADSAADITAARAADRATDIAADAPANQVPAASPAAVRIEPANIRHADPATLEAALQTGRNDLLGLFDSFERALGGAGLRIACDPVLNPPLWELGHIGWFEEHWLARNRERRRGVACDPAAPRAPSLRADADALYDSSKVPHARRWQLDLPTPAATRAYSAEVRDGTLGLLRELGDSGHDSDDELYFFRLVLLHEDMHREAWHFMAQRLGIDLGPAMRRTRSSVAKHAEGEWQVPAGVRHIGQPAEARGFAFDNELGGHERFVDAFAIDRSAVSWSRFLPFIEAGGYRTPAFWSAAGWAWRSERQREQPGYLRRCANGWEQKRFGRWLPLDLDAPALHLSAHEADAWCRWAGRRLPSEAEWETAALLAARSPGDATFDWGDVWEWTSSAFAPYPGFVAHPYRDYSQPWFDGRPVLRGGSFATTPHLVHPRYRNFFPADRDDVFAGFRSCAPRATRAADAGVTLSAV